MSCGAAGPLGRPRPFTPPQAPLGLSLVSGLHVSGQGSWRATGKRPRRRRSGLAAVARRPGAYGSRTSRLVRRFAGADAGSGFEFGSRFDDMPGGVRRRGVNGQGKGGGKVNIALDAEPEGSPVFGQFK